MVPNLMKKGDNSIMSKMDDIMKMLEKIDANTGGTTSSKRKKSSALRAECAAAVEVHYRARKARKQLLELNKAVTALYNINDSDDIDELDDHVDDVLEDFEDVISDVDQIIKRLRVNYPRLLDQAIRMYEDEDEDDEEDDEDEYDEDDDDEDDDD